MEQAKVLVVPTPPPLRRTDRSQHDRHVDVAIWSGYGALVAVFAAYVVALLVHGQSESWPVFNDWGVAAFEVAGGVLCLARGLTKRPGRVVPLTLGLGLLMWALGDLVTDDRVAGRAMPSTPSLADLFLLGFFPFTYVAVVSSCAASCEARHVQLAGRRGCRPGGAARLRRIRVRQRPRAAGGTAIATVTNLAYPIADVLLLSLMVGGSTLMAGRRKAPWILHGTGQRRQRASATPRTCSVPSLGTVPASSSTRFAWPASILLLSMSVWLRPRPADPFAAQKPSTFAHPGGVSAGSCVGHPRRRKSLHSTSRVAVLPGRGDAPARRSPADRFGARDAHAEPGTPAPIGHRRVDRLWAIGGALFTVLDCLLRRLRLSVAQSPERSPSCSSISTISRKSTTPSAIQPATNCSGSWPPPVQLPARRRHADPIGRRRVRRAPRRRRYRVRDRGSRAVDRRVGPAVPARGGARQRQREHRHRARAHRRDRRRQLVVVRGYRDVPGQVGGVPFETYQSDIDKIGNRVQLLADLRIAIDEHQLVLYYQPQLDLRTGKVVAVEACCAGCIPGWVSSRRSSFSRSPRKPA